MGMYGLNMGACGQVDNALDLRLKGLGFNSHCWSYVEVLVNFTLHTASAHPAVMGIWWNEKLETCEWH